LNSEVSPATSSAFAATHCLWCSRTSGPKRRTCSFRSAFARAAFSSAGSRASLRSTTAAHMACICFVVVIFAVGIHASRTD
jgi:hypothetical protein